MKKHNFNAGPAILPASVIEESAQAIRDFNNSGMSILEISHRSPDFIPLMDEASALVKKLIGLDENYEVLFLTGGASTQFYMSAMNLLDNDQIAAYADTGSWSSKAIKEAKLFGKIEVVASSKSENYTYIPKGFKVPDNAKYMHITTNNTIFGTQYHHLPETNVPLVADMSSDFLSRPIDYKRFDLIYGGAQKNLGPAGVSLVIVNKSALGKVSRTIPTMLNYQTHIEHQSSYNTPPVFPIFVCLLTLRWIEKQGGLNAIEKNNKIKADLFYNTLDANPLFIGTAHKEDRSLMNATFLLKDVALEKEFLTLCKSAGIEGLKGHRSVGGFRASIYNAMPLESVEVLTQIMNDFAVQKG